MSLQFRKTKIILLLMFSAAHFWTLQNGAFGQIGQKTKPAVSSVVKFAARPDREALRILSLVNAERLKHGLNQLVWSEDAAKIAVQYSSKMARENFFSHFDSAGRDVVERAKSARLKRWSKIGENLFAVEPMINFDLFAVKNWMKSPTHRQNILNEEWTTTGIGIARAADGEIYITQVFIKR